MRFLRSIPAFLALLALGAHLLRAGCGLFLLPVALIALLFVRRAWALRVLQAGLLLGALEWVRTLVLLALERRAVGLPFLRMALILGAVALTTALAALILPAARSSAARD